MRVKIIGQRDKRTNGQICDALQKANPALYATVRELIDTDISLSAFLKIWKAHNVGIIENLSNGRLTDEDGALQFYVYIKKLREKKHLKENLNQFQLIKRMLDDLELRDDERLFLNKQLAGLIFPAGYAEQVSRVSLFSTYSQAIVSHLLETLSMQACCGIIKCC